MKYKKENVYSYSFSTSRCRFHRILSVLKPTKTYITSKTRTLLYKEKTLLL